MKAVLTNGKYSMGLNFFWALKDDLNARRKVHDIQFRFDELNNLLICKLIRGTPKELIIERLVFQGNPDASVARIIDLQIDVNGSPESIAETYKSINLGVCRIETLKQIKARSGVAS